MGMFSLAGRALRSVFNVKKWMNIDDVGRTSSAALNDVYSLFHPHNAKRFETFDEAVARLRLNPTILAQLKHTFMNYTRIFLVVTLGCIGYAGYLFWVNAWLPGVATLVISGISLSICFRYHFWWFQIHSKKLGCHLGDYIQFFIRKDKRLEKLS